MYLIHLDSILLGSEGYYDNVKFGTHMHDGSDSIIKYFDIPNTFL